jgi:hypothetical protein
VLLSLNEIEAELSYAYLHAIASRSGFACEVAGRQSDRAGIDARLHVRERLAENAVFTDFPIEIQLKATSREPVIQRGHYSYWLKSDHYDKLRDPGVWNLRLLVVLFLPEDQSQWLSHDEEGLLTRRCAYWVSLKGAGPSDNETGQTVYLPKANCFSQDGLRALATRFACKEAFSYVVP